MANKDWLNDLEKLRNIPVGEPFICMFSGGKDSGLALSTAMEKGNVIALIHCLDKDGKESLFHEQEIKTVESQAAALNIPITYQYYKWWIRWDKIVKKYMEYKKQGVKYVVFGDLNSEGNVNVQVNLCLSAGLIPCVPLYLLPYEFLLDEIDKRGIKSIITTITHPSIGSEWLGKVFDRQAYEHFIKLDIDPFGEAGEFHTTLVDIDRFNNPLNYKIISNDGKKIVINIQT